MKKSMVGNIGSKTSLPAGKAGGQIVVK